MRTLTVKVVIGLLVMTIMMTGFAPLVEAATTTYTVQPGDSLWKIAKQHNTSVNNLKSLNKDWSNKVRAGQKLQVPATGWTYTVKKGESLWSVAKKVGLSVTKLKNANGLKSNTVKAGQKLWIPAGGSTAASASSKSKAANLSKKDIYLLARVIHAEARGESFKGQVAVGAVLLNRIESSKFPNSLSGVIYQKNAFETVSNGTIWLTPGKSAYNAAVAAVNGQDPTNGALYFYNPAKVKNPKNWIWSRKVTLRIGRHSFAV